PRLPPSFPTRRSSDLRLSGSPHTACRDMAHRTCRTAPRREPPRSCSRQIFKLPTEQRPIPEPPPQIRPAIERHPRGDRTRPDAGVALRLWNRKMRRVIASRNCRHLHPVTAHIAASSERHVVPKVLSLLRLDRKSVV